MSLVVYINVHELKFISIIVFIFKKYETYLICQISSILYLCICLNVY